MQILYLEFPIFNISTYYKHIRKFISKKRIKQKFRLKFSLVFGFRWTIKIFVSDSTNLVNENGRFTKFYYPCKTAGGQ